MHRQIKIGLNLEVSITAQKLRKIAAVFEDNTRFYSNRDNLIEKCRELKQNKLSHMKILGSKFSKSR